MKRGRVSNRVSVRGALAGSLVAAMAAMAGAQVEAPPMPGAQAMPGGAPAMPGGPATMPTSRPRGGGGFGNRGPMTRPANTSSTKPAARTPGRHEQFLKRAKEGPVGVLFLGDSITDWWPTRGPDTWAKFAEYQPADFAVAGDRTEHLLWHLSNGELDEIKPKLAVMMIGTNNIGLDTAEQIAAGVKANLDYVREKLPETKILLLGVFPRATPGSQDRERALAINPLIEKFADGKTIRYLDIGKVFLDADGNIPRDVMGDGLHPTAKGYQLWYDAMKPTFDEMWNAK